MKYHTDDDEGHVSIARTSDFVWLVSYLRTASILTFLCLHPQVVIFRGLRLKCGLDCGKLQGEINGITGRMSYRWDGSYGPDGMYGGHLWDQ